MNIQEQTAPLSPIKQALIKIEELKSKLKQYEAVQHEPIAIVGMGCRFPGGANTPAAYWELLRAGGSAVSEAPWQRWQHQQGNHATENGSDRSTTHYGHYLQEVGCFDASFFGISPREAQHMDPQQQLLLEVSIEALEHANLPVDGMLESRTGVYIGLMNQDHLQSLHQSDNLDVYAGTGSEISFMAGRLSYLLGVRGPCMTVATACSSSLVTTHLACQALRAKECDLALSGGVSLVLADQSNIMLGKMQATSPDGRSKTFDAAADGYGRGEGCGVLVLKRLSDAQRDGDTIWALIRGSAVNHDGRSGGLTVPSGPAQEELLRQALTAARVDASAVSYIEAHGTGTVLGDPIEIRALGNVLGKNRQTPLFVGSAKTNIGHLEPAAGVAGLIKVILSLYNKQIPPHLHLREPNPHIPWSQYPLQIPTSLTEWTAQQPRIAGVSSFGLSGINAHVILEEAPADSKDPIVEERPYHLLTLSAKHPQALAMLAHRYHDHLQTSADGEFADLCATSHSGRTHFQHRLGLVATSFEDAHTKLTAYLKQEPAAGIIAKANESPSHTGTGRIAYLFTGQGSQYRGMGGELYATNSTFRSTLDHCDALLRPLLGESILAILSPESGVGNLIDDTTYTQPALFVLEVALATLWQSWGIQPDILIGHSVGEVAAACVAGVFSLEDGLKLVAARGRLMGALAQEGEMVSLLTDEARVQAALAPYRNDVSIAAINGPESIVISGKREAVQAIAEQLAGEGVKSRKLTVSHAFHSPLMEPMMAEFGQVARSIHYHKAKVPLISNLSGKVAGDEISTPEYWVRHVREAVRFADGLQSLQEQGIGIFLEIGPKPVLLGLAEQVASGSSSSDPCFLPSLREGQSDWQQMLSSLGEMYVRGVDINWHEFDKDYQRRKLVLPTYPFQRQRYWMEKTALPHPSASEAPRQPTTALIEYLQQGHVTKLVELLQASGKLPRTAQEFLPGFVELLVAQQRQQAAYATIEDWLYEIVWQPRPLWGRAPDYLPSPAQVLKPLTDHWEVQVEDPALQRSFAAQKVLEDLCIDYVLQAFTEAGFVFITGDHWSSAEIAKQLGVVPAYFPLLEHLLQMLAEEGILVQSSAGWQVVRIPQREKLAVKLQAVRAQVADTATIELALLERCGAGLGAVLRGQQNVLELLFADDTSAKLYQESPVAQLMNNLMQQAVLRAIAQIPAGQGVRILEIGGGTGGTTTGLLSMLASALDTRHIEYCFSDVGSSFINQARRKFANYDFVRYQTLDIDQPPEAQGFARHYYDLVIAANVLHATQDLTETLAHIQRLLAPGGHLMLLESTTKLRWTALTFGLTDGWWRFADQRQGYPLLATTQWQPLLTTCGFQAVACSPTAALADGKLGQAVIVAQATTTLAPTGRQWLIFADASGMGGTLAEQLRQRGETPILVSTGNVYQQLDSHHFQIDPTQAVDYQTLLASLPSLHGVVHLWSLEGNLDEPLQACQQSCGTVLKLVQALAQWRTTTPKLWLVTLDSQAVQPTDCVRGVVQSALWGMGKVIAQEHPELQCVRIDLDGQEALVAQASRLAAELTAYPITSSPAGVEKLEDQVALRAGIRYVARLARYQKRQTYSQSVTIRPDATYLITGGLGGLGLLVARWLVEQGACHLVLMGRNQPKGEAQQQLQALIALGARVQVAQADVSDYGQVAQALAQIDPSQPLAGVIHAAGVAEEACLLTNKFDWARFTRTLAPKLVGTWNLHKLTRDLPLDFFVAFSSMASLLGDLGVGLADYAAANAFLDAFAHYRQAQALPALSINWGIWAKVGMAAVDSVRNQLAQLEKDGHSLVAPTEGIVAFAHLVGQEAAQIAVAPVDWEKFSRQATHSAFFAELFSADRQSRTPQNRTEDVAHSAKETSVNLRKQLLQTPVAQQPAWLTQHLTALVAQALGLSSSATIDPHQNLLALGFDSLMAVELRNRLRQIWGVSIEMSRFLAGISLQELVAELLLLENQSAGIIPTNQPEAAYMFTLEAESIDGESATSEEHGEEQWITGKL